MTKREERQLKGLESHIKEFLVQIDRNNQLVIQIPSKFNDEPKKFGDILRKLDGFTEEDVVVDSVEIVDLEVRYLVTVSGVLSLALVEKADGDITYIQLELKEV